MQRRRRHRNSVKLASHLSWELFSKVCRRGHRVGLLSLSCESSSGESCACFLLHWTHFRAVAVQLLHWPLARAGGLAGVGLTRGVLQSSFRLQSRGNITLRVHIYLPRACCFAGAAVARTDILVAVCRNYNTSFVATFQHVPPLIYLCHHPIQRPSQIE